MKKQVCNKYCMKILCVSDQIDPLVYSNSAKERYSDIDIVLCAGDLPMEYVDYIVSTLNLPTYFVFGNHNLSEFGHYHRIEVKNVKKSQNPYDMSCSHGAAYAGFKVIRDFSFGKNPLLIAGASGSTRYNNGLCQYTDRAMYIKLLKMFPALLYNRLRYGRWIDIFLTHSPPLGIHDKNDPCHTGFKCYRWFLKKFKPAYMVHGHIHLYDMQSIRVSLYHNTTIVNAYSQYIIDLEKKD